MIVELKFDNADAVTRVVVVNVCASSSHGHRLR